MPNYSRNLLKFSLTLKTKQKWAIFAPHQRFQKTRAQNPQGRQFWPLTILASSTYLIHPDTHQQSTLYKNEKQKTTATLSARSPLKMERQLFILGLSAIFVGAALGHGMLWDPPNRSSYWRIDPSYPANYDDNQNYCGGMTVSSSYIAAGQGNSETLATSRDVGVRPRCVETN